MPAVWEDSALYRLLRPYVDACTRRSYSSLTVEGSLPEDGAVIIAPNHTNTLMDALVVLQSRRDATVFGARADIFRKPAIARILRFLRILPFSRQRDGNQAVLDNYRTFEEVDETLAHGVPFCLFPEGRHRPMHSLLPMGKGVARIAFRSAESRQTYLVPTGIEYGDYFRFRSSCRLRFGEPIDVNAFLAAHADLGESERYKALREELFNRIKELILYIPDDGDYLAKWSKIRRSRMRPDTWWKWPVLVLTAPFFLLSALLLWPLVIPAESLHLSDPAWRNTVRFGFLFAGKPLLFVVWAVVLLLYCPWWAAMAVLAFYFVADRVFYDWLNALKRQ